MGKIFISHAVADKDLVDAFVDFLITACGVKQEDIFCTSLEGMNIKEGADFYKVIHDSMKNSEFVIMLITPAYYESVFCLCELGATWILQHNCFPIIVPPLSYADLKAVLTPMQAAVLNNPDKLGNLFDRLKDIKLGSGATARFVMKRDAFLKKLEDMPIRGRTVVPSKEHEALKEQYDAALQENVSLEKELARVRKQFEELAKKKDSADVSAVRLSGSKEPQQFERLCEDFKQAASKIPSAALEAIYQENRGEEYVLPDVYGNEGEYEDAKRADEKQFVKLNDRLVTSRDSHPRVRELNACLSTLSKFMDKASEPFQEKYESENGHQFSLENRDFWETNLGL